MRKGSDLIMSRDYKSKNTQFYSKYIKTQFNKYNLSIKSLVFQDNLGTLCINRFFLECDVFERSLLNLCFLFFQDSCDCFLHFQCLITPQITHLILQVLHAFATEGAHCAKVRDILNASDVSSNLTNLFLFFWCRYLTHCCSWVIIVL